jgi:cytochrome c-type biogenesis protein CcmF
LPLVGRGLLVAALAFAIWAAASAVLSAVRRDRRLVETSRRAVYLQLAAMLGADAVLMTAILTHDFTFRTVAISSARDVPFGYLVTSFWSTQAGSLMLWATVLAVYGAIVVATNRRRNGELMPWVIAVMSGTAVFFDALVLVAARPFQTQPAVADGAGMTPSLQNPYMIAHPPTLYLGFVGLIVPFAFCIAALASGRVDARWIVATRRWTLWSWGCLGVGMLLGAHWAYEEIGWGGYWGWDAVENAALIPWLVATAFLHSVMVQEKKGMLKVWNAVLVCAAYLLALFGTFLTRSGAVSSVHAFARSEVGPWFSVFIPFVLVASLSLIIWRLPLLRSGNRIESLVSREATFLFNNVLLVGIAFAVLWGTSLPLVTEAIQGSRTTVGPPFFEFFVRVFGLPLLLLMGTGPVVAWRRASLSSLRRSFGIPFLIAVVIGLILVALGFGSSPVGLAGLCTCAFVAITILDEFRRGASARRALSRDSWPVAIGALFRRNRRRYGGYIVHLAIVLLVFGIVGVGAYGAAGGGTVAPGQSINVRNYRLDFVGVQRTRGANYTQTGAVFRVFRNGKPAGLATPARRLYDGTNLGDNTSTEASVRADLKRGGDLFVRLDTFDSNGRVKVQVLLNPAIDLIWIAGIVFLLGTATAAWPDARESRRLARRYAEAAVPGEV